MKLPEHILRMLRLRHELDVLDTSSDADFREMTPVEVVRECVTWELGDPSWANHIAGWMHAVGAKPEDF